MASQQTLSSACRRPPEVLLGRHISLDPFCDFPLTSERCPNPLTCPVIPSGSVQLPQALLREGPAGWPEMPRAVPTTARAGGSPSPAVPTQPLFPTSWAREGRFPSLAEGPPQAASPRGCHVGAPLRRAPVKPHRARRPVGSGLCRDSRQAPLRTHSGQWSGAGREVCGINWAAPAPPRPSGWGPVPSSRGMAWSSPGHLPQLPDPQPPGCWRSELRGGEGGRSRPLPCPLASAQGCCAALGKSMGREALCANKAQPCSQEPGRGESRRPGIRPLTSRRLPPNPASTGSRTMASVYLGKSHQRRRTQRAGAMRRVSRRRGCGCGARPHTEPAPEMGCRGRGGAGAGGGGARWTELSPAGSPAPAP